MFLFEIHVEYRRDTDSINASFTLRLTCCFTSAVAPSLFQTSEIGVTEHIEGDECKFALWTGTVAPISDYKVILRVSQHPSQTSDTRSFSG